MSIRDEKKIFFDMVDENGISYANMSNTIHYISVDGKVNQINRRIKELANNDSYKYRLRSVIDILQ